MGDVTITVDDDDGDHDLNCGHEHELAVLRDAIAAEHDAQHPGAFRYCREPLCRAAGGR